MKLLLLLVGVTHHNKTQCHTCAIDANFMLFVIDNFGSKSLYIYIYTENLINNYEFLIKENVVFLCYSMLLR